MLDSKQPVINHFFIIRRSFYYPDGIGQRLY